MLRGVLFGRVLLLIFFFCFVRFGVQRVYIFRDGDIVYS
jgi:hypothetical protein